MRASLSRCSYSAVRASADRTSALAFSIAPCVRAYRSARTRASGLWTSTVYSPYSRIKKIMVGNGSGLARRRSTGIRRKSDEPVRQALGILMEGLAFSAGMAADLALVEDQGQGIGEKPDHGQHHQGCGLVDRRGFEMTVGGEGLKDFGIDSPTAATELMNEQRRDRAEFEIGSVEVGARLRYRGLAGGAMTVFFSDRDAVLVFDANRFDDPHPAIGDGPIDFRQVPVLNLPARRGVN